MKAELTIEQLHSPLRKRRSYPVFVVASSSGNMLNNPLFFEVPEDYHDSTMFVTTPIRVFRQHQDAVDFVAAQDAEEYNTAQTRKVRVYGRDVMAVDSSDPAVLHVRQVWGTQREENSNRATTNRVREVSS